MRLQGSFQFLEMPAPVPLPKDAAEEAAAQAWMVITSRKINTVPSILEAERAHSQMAVHWLE